MGLEATNIFFRRPITAKKKKGEPDLSSPFAQPQ
jgi:hypothetical protein